MSYTIYGCKFGLNKYGDRVRRGTGTVTYACNYLLGRIKKIIIHIVELYPQCMDPDGIDALNHLSEKIEDLQRLLNALAKAVLAHNEW